MITIDLNTVYFEMTETIFRNNFEMTCWDKIYVPFVSLFINSLVGAGMFFLQIEE